MLRIYGLVLMIFFGSFSHASSDCLDAVKQAAMEKRIQEKAMAAQKEFEDLRKRKFFIRTPWVQLGDKFLRYMIRRNGHDGHPWILMRNGFAQRIRRMVKLQFDDPRIQDVIAEVNQLLHRADTYSFDILRLNYRTYILQEKVRIMEEAFAENPHSKNEIHLRVPELVNFDENLNPTIIYLDKVYDDAEHLKTAIGTLYAAEPMKLRDNDVRKRKYQLGRHLEQAERWWMLSVVAQEFVKFPGAYRDVVEQGEAFQKREELRKRVQKVLSDNSVAPDPDHFHRYTTQVGIFEFQHFREKDNDYTQQGSDSNDFLWPNDRHDLNVSGERTSPVSRLIRNVGLAIIPVYAFFTWGVPFISETWEMRVRETQTQINITKTPSEREYRKKVSSFMDYHFDEDWENFDPSVPISLAPPSAVRDTVDNLVGSPWWRVVYNPWKTTGQKMQAELSEFALYRGLYLRHTILAIAKSQVITARGSLPPKDAEARIKKIEFAQKILNVAVVARMDMRAKAKKKMLNSLPEELRAQAEVLTDKAIKRISDGRSQGLNLEEVLFKEINEISKADFH